MQGSAPQSTKVIDEEIEVAASLRVVGRFHLRSTERALEASMEVKKKMTHEEIQDRLNDYVDNQLDVDERRDIEEHLESCMVCKESLQRLEKLLERAKGLPQDIQPQRDLWPGIARRLGPLNPKVFPLASSMVESRRWLPSASQVLKAAAAVAVALGGYWFATRSSSKAWEVTTIDGTPKIEHERIAGTGRLGIGQWLETDEKSRARLTIADIGNAEIGPNSRIRLLVTKASEQRLEMVQGHMKASVSSPPKIFIVETPSSTAVDLGCSYDLYVNEVGNGTIHVTSGEVSMEYNGRESFVPTGTMCETKRGVGPGTPYSDLSSETIRRALRSFDFEDGGAKALNMILDKASHIEAITLWHLLQRVDETDRSRVFDRFATLLPPPKGVTKEGILRLDKNMLEAWLNEFAVRSYTLKRLFSMN